MIATPFSMLKLSNQAYLYGREVETELFYVIASYYLLVIRIDSRASFHATLLPLRSSTKSLR
jgi:predicted LPLAT superfamily acyltransferase